MPPRASVALALALARVLLRRLAPLIGSWRCSWEQDDARRNHLAVVGDVRCPRRR